MAEKRYAGCRGRPAENFALLGKLREFMRIISRWPTLSLIGVIAYRFAAQLPYMKHLIFFCRYVEPFRSYALPIVGGARKLRFSLANFRSRGEKIEST